eukprot:1752035-Rhodomonas_salina.1
MDPVLAAEGSLPEVTLYGHRVQRRPTSPVQTLSTTPYKRSVPPRTNAQYRPVQTISTAVPRSIIPVPTHAVPAPQYHTLCQDRSTA